MIRRWLNLNMWDSGYGGTVDTEELRIQKVNSKLCSDFCLWTVSVHNPPALSTGQLYKLTKPHTVWRQPSSLTSSCFLLACHCAFVGKTTLGLLHCLFSVFVCFFFFINCWLLCIIQMLTLHFQRGLSGPFNQYQHIYLL